METNRTGKSSQTDPSKEEDLKTIMGGEESGPMEEKEYGDGPYDISSGYDSWETRTDPGEINTDYEEMDTDAGTVRNRRFPVWILFIGIFAVAVVLIFLVHQMGGSRFAEEDARNLVQAELDAVFTGEYDKDSEYFTLTEKEVKEQRQQYIDQSRDEIVKLLESQDFQVTDEQKDQISGMLDKTLRKADYTVGEAVMNDKENFTVQVRVKPLDLYYGLDTAFINGQISQLIKEDRSIIKDEPRLYSTMLDRILDQLINVNLEDPEYRGEEEKSVRIQQNQDEEWIVNIEDLDEVESALIFTDEFLEDVEGEE